MVNFIMKFNLKPTSDIWQALCNFYGRLHSFAMEIYISEENLPRWLNILKHISDLNQTQKLKT